MVSSANENCFLFKKIDLMKMIEKRINCINIIPAEAIPEATPRASRIPIAIKRDFGRAIISSVTIPARYRIYSIEK